MAKVQCPKCYTTFHGSPLKGASAAAASAALGAYFGSGIGIALGPLGAIAGTLPGAFIGGVVGYLGSGKLYKCPACGKYFKL